MKKILIFLAFVGLISCEDVGYIATIEVRQESKKDTIRVPYWVNQVSSTHVFGPSLEINNGMLLKQGAVVYQNVESFSLLNVERLENE